jgi:hypothetical protein
LSLVGAALGGAALALIVVGVVRCANNKPARGYIPVQDTVGAPDTNKAIIQRNAGLSVNRY